jgi:DNA-binding winged helix-turn-helix (wHTH) protein/Tfp pilus assembly protein PilF
MAVAGVSRKRQEENTSDASKTHIDSNTYIEMWPVRVRFGEYEVDFARRELRKSGVRVRLERKPFRVLELLLRHPGELVTREELCRYLWPDSHVSFEHSLNTAVNSLRQALGESSRDSRFIETRPGVGYRFCGLVDAVKRLPRNRMDNGDAHEDYAKGRYFLDRMSENELHRAIAFFKAAAAEGSCLALAHAGIADAHCQLALLGFSCPFQVASRARHSAELALKDNPGLAEAHVAFGRVKMIFDWDWNAAEEAVRRALALDPSAASAHVLAGALLCSLGRYDEARETCSRALAIDPLSFAANLQVAACLYAAREWERAADQCWNMLTLLPRFAPAQIQLAQAYEELRMYDEALVEYGNARSSPGFEPAATAGIGELLAVTGRDQESEEAYRELTRQAETRYVAPYFYALICAGRRQEEQALWFLENSFREHDPALLSVRGDARFRGIRDCDRFRAMVKGMGPKYREAAL